MRFGQSRGQSHSPPIELIDGGMLGNKLDDFSSRQIFLLFSRLGDEATLNGERRQNLFAAIEPDQPFQLTQGRGPVPAFDCLDRLLRDGVFVVLQGDQQALFDSAISFEEIAFPAAKNMRLFGEGQLGMIGNLQLELDRLAPGLLKPAPGHFLPLIQQFVLSIGDRAQDDLERFFASGGRAESPEKFASAFDILAVQPAEDEEVIGEIAGADPGFVGKTGATVDQHVIETAGLADDRFEGPEQRLADAILVKLVEIQGIEALAVVAIEPAGGHDVERTSARFSRALG